jgi:hypothetical protein
MVDTLDQIQNIVAHLGIDCTLSINEEYTRGEVCLSLEILNVRFPLLRNFRRFVGTCRYATEKVPRRKMKDCK